MLQPSVVDAVIATRSASTPTSAPTRPRGARRAAPRTRSNRAGVPLPSRRPRSSSATHRVEASRARAGRRCPPAGTRGARATGNCARASSKVTRGILTTPRLTFGSCASSSPTRPRTPLLTTVARRGARGRGRGRGARHLPLPLRRGRDPERLPSDASGSIPRPRAWAQRGWARAAAPGEGASSIPSAWRASRPRSRTCCTSSGSARRSSTAGSSGRARRSSSPRTTSSRAGRRPRPGSGSVLFGRCDRVVVHSERGRGALVELGVPEERLRVIPHPAFRSEVDRRDDGRTALAPRAHPAVQGRRGRGRGRAARSGRAAARRGRPARAARRPPA